MTTDPYTKPAMELLKEQLLALLARVRGGAVDFKRSRVPLSVLLTGFGINQSTLTPGHLATLAELAETLLTDAALEIDLIIGRASQTGNEANNLVLSKARAKAVRDELSALAVYPPAPVDGYGASQAIAQLPGRESDLNRSVEIRLWYDLAHFYSGMRGPAPGGVHPVKIDTYEHAWEKGFRNLTDLELERFWTQIVAENLTDYEASRFHDYFVTSIVNAALELARRKVTSGTLKEKVKRAWSHVQDDLREATNKADRTGTIYRDAERIVEVAEATLGGVFLSTGGNPGGITMILGQVVLYDPGKLVAWSIYDTVGNDWLLSNPASTTGDYPTRAGGLHASLMGFNYGMLYRDLPDPPLLPLATGTREAVQQELLGQ